MHLLKVDTLNQAREKMARAFADSPGRIVEVSAADAWGRISACDVRSPEMIPAFRRSSVDGYAVRARDTRGAGESIPTFLELLGEVQMGQAAAMKVESGQCVYVPTGGMLPEGADAMVMVEYSELFGESQVALYTSAAPGSGMVQAGDDMREGDILFPAGRRIRAQEIGAMAAAGISRVQVFEPLRVTVLSTGDELVPPGEPVLQGQVRDVNSCAVSAIARELGLVVTGQAMVRDDREALLAALRDAAEKSDIVAISGGSSQGKKDMTEQLIEEVTAGGVFTHGLALKPGKPTILGWDGVGETLFVGLPGHPVAAMMVFRLLVSWLLQSLYHIEDTDYVIEATMTSNVPGAPGRDTCLLVEISGGAGDYRAKPVFGKSGLISTLTQANGYVMITMDQEGLKTGERVLIHRI